MKFNLIPLLMGCLLLVYCKSEKKIDVTPDTEIETNVASVVEAQKEDIKIFPIQHATAILKWSDKVIYIDPTGGEGALKGYKIPDIVLITDIHGDHMDIETLEVLDLSKAKIVVPQAVAEKLPASLNEQMVIINNGETKTVSDISIEAIPMYNLREEALKFHQKGRGNGYVITLGSERLYFSGGTEDIPEMRALKDIDKAFVCMNLPYTMTVESAADAVLAFKPKQIYPYHYRGTEGLSDVSKFKEVVNKGNPAIEVVQLDWYAQ